MGRWGSEAKATTIDADSGCGKLTSVGHVRPVPGFAGVDCVEWVPPGSRIVKYALSMRAKWKTKGRSREDLGFRKTMKQCSRMSVSSQSGAGYKRLQRRQENKLHPDTGLAIGASTEGNHLLWVYRPFFFVTFFYFQYCFNISFYVLWG